MKKESQKKKARVGGGDRANEGPTVGRKRVPLRKQKEGRKRDRGRIKSGQKIRVRSGLGQGQENVREEGRSSEEGRERTKIDRGNMLSAERKSPKPPKKSKEGGEGGSPEKIRGGEKLGGGTCGWVTKGGHSACFARRAKEKGRGPQGEAEKKKEARRGY